MDACRGLMYVLRGDNSVQVFSVSEKIYHVCDLPSYTVNSAVFAAIRAAGLEARITSSDDLVALIASSPHVGGEVLFVGITRTGTRVFVRATGADRTGPTNIHSVSILSVKVPDRHPALTIESALSYDSGRSIFMIASNGVVSVRPDEASVVARHNSKILPRERFDFVPLAGVVRFATLVPDQSGAPAELFEKTLAPGLLSVSTDDLGTVNRKRLIVLSSEGREMVVTIPRASELVVSVLVSKNLHAIRDLSIQFGSDQLAGILFSVLSTLKGDPTSGDFNQLVERIMFSQDTATALGFVDIGAGSGFGIPAQSTNPLGAVMQTVGSNVSARTKGLALFISRLVRPIWFMKAFKLEIKADILLVKPVLTSTQRHYMQSLFEPVNQMVTQYRYQLGTDMSETKLVEGFVVLVTSILECMELMRIIESGQLTLRGDDVPAIEVPVELLNEVDNIQMRDLLSGTAAGATLEQLFSDMSVVRKHCSLIFP